MSELKVTSIEANNISANLIVAGQTTVNSSGLYLNSTSGVINSSAIVVSNASGNVILQGTTNLASITINGTEYTSLVNETVNTQIFTANGTWTKPSWATTNNELVVVHLWGGGGGGSSSNSAGGGGGAFVFGYYKMSQLGNTANVVVGAGGSASGSGNGEPSSFANGNNTLLIAYGGGSGGGSSSGCGGGWLGTGNTTVGGAPLGGNTTAGSADSTFGGGGGADTRNSIYGGGGGSGSGAAGNSVFGGGGGSKSSAVGTSIYGGFGGNTTQLPTIPGGGGGTQQSGARGEVRVYTYRSLEPEPILIGSTDQQVTTGSSITVTLPAGIKDGDLITVFHICSDPRTIVGNAAFTTAVSGGAQVPCAVYWKIASSEPASYDFATSGSTRHSAVCTVWRNASFGGAGSIVETSATSSLAVTGVTLPSSGNKILLVGAGGFAATYNDVTNFTTLYKSATRTAYYTGYRTISSSGASETVTVTNGGPTDWMSGVQYYITKP